MSARAIPAGTLVFVQPMPEPATQLKSLSEEAEKAAQTLLKPGVLRQAPPYMAGLLKILLKDFNVKTHEWKATQ